MNRQGTIKKIEGKYVWISLAPLGCCGGSEGGSCHCSSTTSEVEFKAINSKGLTLSPGDYVDISNPTGASWGGVVRLLVIPGALLAAGLMWFGAWGAAAGAALGLGASLLFPQSKDSGYPTVEQIVPVADFTPLAGFGANLGAKA